MTAEEVKALPAGMAVELIMEARATDGTYLGCSATLCIVRESSTGGKYLTAYPRGMFPIPIKDSPRIDYRLP